MKTTEMFEMMQLRTLAALNLQLGSCHLTSGVEEAAFCACQFVRNFGSHRTLVLQTNLEMKLLAISKYLTGFFALKMANLLLKVMHASYTNTAH
jgi:hypothetical protein